MMTKHESVAQAIYEARNGAGCKPWSLQTKAHKAPYLADASAALSAIEAAGFVVVKREHGSHARQIHQI